jgi:very-short-patch-repair endonuclease
MVSETYNSKNRKSLRRKLRNSTTSAEAILWGYLQRRKLEGKKFRRHESLGRYVVDFYCPECRLIVELDGAPHFEPNSDIYENERTAYLEGLGLTVIRFENQVIHDAIELVLECIREAIRNAPPRCAAKEASRLLLNGAASPPRRGGENSQPPTPRR